MSARDAESGSSTYKGGSGRAGGLGNGGIGGGMGGGGNYGGGMGGGAARNGGIGSRTGLTGGNTMYGNTAYGQAGGNVQAYGMRDARSLARAGMGPTAGTYGNFRTPSGQAMYGSSPVQGQSFRGMNMGQALSQAQRAQAAYEAAQRASRPGVPGLLGGTPTAAGVIVPQQPVSMPGYMPTYPAIAPYQNLESLNATSANDDFGFATDYGVENELVSFSPEELGIGPNSPGSTYNQNGSTFSKNNQGDYGRLGNQSTQYKSR